MLFLSVADLHISLTIVALHDPLLYVIFRIHVALSKSLSSVHIIKHQ